jgi:uncharacterized protein GlcG (DUF336 family)
MRRPVLRLLCAGIVALAGVDGAAAQLLDKKALSLAEVKNIAAAAEAEAQKLYKPFCIAIMDEGGRLLYFERMDGAQWASVRIAQDKARAAIAFKRPTKTFEERVAGGAVNVLTLHGVVASEGGVPLMAAGQIVGSIGVSGGTSAEDGQVANAGAASLK